MKYARLFIAGEWGDGAGRFDILDRFARQPVARGHSASAAKAAAAAADDPLTGLPALAHGFDQLDGLSGVSKVGFNADGHERGP